MKRAFFFTLIIFSISAHSFNWRRCTTGQDLGTKHIFGVTTSSAQFTTSTGGCKMFGATQSKKSKMFYAINYDKIKEDAARGGGEYLEHFAYLSGCQKNYSTWAHTLQIDFEKVFKNQMESSYNLIIENCEEII